MNRHPYPAYKPSGVEWLGEIPSHWDVRRLRYLASGSLMYGANEAALETDPDFPRFVRITDISEDGSLRPETFKSLPSEIAEPYLLQEGDILLARSGATVGKTFIYRKEWGKACFAGYLIRFPCNRDFLLPDFLFSFTQSHVYWSQVRGDTIQATIQNFSAEKYREILIPLPSLVEQRAIAAHLDRETTRIDTLLKKKQKQIELLQEKRTALIHDASHDSSTRTMRIGHVADQIFRPISRKDDDTYTPVGLYNWGRGIFHKEPTTGAELGDSNFFWLDADDLILSGQFAWEGAVALTSEKDKGCVATHRYPILRGKPGVIETAYLFAFFTTKTGDFLLNDHSRGAAGRNRPLNIGTLLKEAIPVPPLETQSRVSAHVYFERRITPIIHRSIQLLREYRTALISAAVTGKIDLRKEAA